MFGNRKTAFNKLNVAALVFVFCLDVFHGDSSRFGVHCLEHFCEFLDGFAGVFPGALWIFGRLCGFPGGFVVFSGVLWVFWWF